MTPPAQECSFSMQLVRALAHAVEQRGVPPAELLRAARLETERLDAAAADARLPGPDFFRLCERALDLTGDPALGLHWSRAIDPNAFAPVSLLLGHSATLSQALETLSQFETLLSDHRSYELRKHGDRATLRCFGLSRTSLRFQRFSAEMMVSGFFKLIRSFDARTRFHRLSFEYPAPAHAAEYTRLFGQRVQFEQPFTGLTFERRLLDLPSPHRDEAVGDALRGVAQHRLARLMQQNLHSRRVRDLLVRHGRPHRVPMKTAARSLALSVRSLQRRLAAEGQSYDALRNEAAAVVAKQLLRDEQLTIKQAADALGFSSTSPFHRAFKRWTGATPSAFRATRGGGDS
jgi:AraC-like DNA-binding protein